MKKIQVLLVSPCRLIKKLRSICIQQLPATKAAKKTWDSLGFFHESPILFDSKMSVWLYAFAPRGFAVPRTRLCGATFCLHHTTKLHVRTRKERNKTAEGKKGRGQTQAFPRSKFILSNTKQSQLFQRLWFYKRQRWTANSHMPVPKQECGWEPPSDSRQCLQQTDTCIRVQSKLVLTQ